MTQKLKPCPFCGMDAGEVFDMGGFYVSCCECEAQGPCRETKEEAIKAWNYRAGEEDND